MRDFEINICLNLKYPKPLKKNSFVLKYILEKYQINFFVLNSSSTSVKQRNRKNIYCIVNQWQRNKTFQRFVHGTALWYIKAFVQPFPLEFYLPLYDTKIETLTNDSPQGKGSIDIAITLFAKLAYNLHTRDRFQKNLFDQIGVFPVYLQTSYPVRYWCMGR